MRIAIDYKHGISEFKTGIAWYTYNLVNNIAKIDAENPYLLYDFKSHNIRQEIEAFLKHSPKQKNFHTRILRIHSELARACCKAFLPIELFIGNNDIIHIPHSGIPVTLKSKVVITIHDLIPFLAESAAWISPGKNGRKYYIKRKDGFCKDVLNSDKIIAVSEYTKNDIIKYFAVKPEKISTIHLGVDTIFRVCEDKKKQKMVLGKYGISKKYIFFVGMVSARKNIVRLVSSFEKIRKQFSDYQLVIAGRRTTYNEFSEKLDNLPADIRNDLLLTEYVSREDLPYLYSGASVCVYPSLYEGFGLPILEAMACGCPVITSNISSMPEVAGGAALLVDPYSTAEIASAMERVLSNPGLQERMREKGMARAKEFSWENTARKTLRVYTEVHEGA